MLKLVVFAEEVVAKGALEDATPVIPHFSGKKQYFYKFVLAELVGQKGLFLWFSVLSYYFSTQKMLLIKICTCLANFLDSIPFSVSQAFFWTFFQKLSLTNKTRQISKLSQLFPLNSDFWLQNSFF